MSLKHLFITELKVEKLNIAKHQKLIDLNHQIKNNIYE
jgi:hypothetical protein